MAPKEKPRVIALAGARRGSNTQVNDMPNTATDTSKKSSRYREMLALPQWQKRRLQMLEKAGWKCVECGAEEQQLHVHHKRYIAGAKPWEYEDEDLAVLCERCHERAHGRGGETFMEALKRRPSSASRILALLIRHPERANEVPLSAIPPQSEERDAIAALIEATKTDQGFSEKAFRSGPHKDVIARAEQKFLELMVPESDEDEMLDDVLTKVCADAIGSQIAALLCFDRERGLDGRERGLLGRLLEAKRDIAHGAFSARLARGL